jgi:hypothetical protein
MANTPRLRAAWTISSAPGTVAAKVFSTRIALPTSIAASAISLCCGCGVAM